MQSGDQDQIYRSMSDIEKTAILLNVLGEKTCTLLFTHMKDMVVRKVVLQMTKTTKAPHWLANRIMKEYYSLLNEDHYLIFEDNFISRTIGKEPTKKLLELGRVK